MANCVPRRERFPVALPSTPNPESSHGQEMPALGPQVVSWAWGSPEG